MKYLIVLLTTFTLSAQENPDDPARPAVGKTGQIFTLKFVPNSKRLQISLVESPLVTLDPDRLTVLGKVYPLNGTAKTIRIRTAGKNLEIIDAVDPNSTLEFQVQDKVTDKTETLMVKPKAKP